MVEIAGLAGVSQVSALLPHGITAAPVPHDLTCKMTGCSEPNYQRVAVYLQACCAL